MLEDAVPGEGIWLGSKPKRNSSSCPGLRSLPSDLSVEGGLEFAVAERQLGSRGNRLRGGVFVTDRIWDQLGWFGGMLERTGQLKGFKASSSPGVLGTEKLCLPWSLEIWSKKKKRIWSSWSDNQHLARERETRVSG